MFTATDRGHVEEIKRALEQLEQDYLINLNSEKEWLDSLEERYNLK